MTNIINATTTPIERVPAGPPSEVAGEHTTERVIHEQTVYAGGQARTTAVEEQTIVVPTPAELRMRQLRRARRVIYFVVNVLAIFLVIRFVLALLGANPENTFASLIYGLTAPFTFPFQGLFGPDGGPAFGVNVFEGTTLVAIAMYYLFAWIASKVASFAIQRPQPTPELEQVA